MPVDIDALAADVAAETAVTRALVAGLDAAGWRTPTPAPNWTIADQIVHLAYFDDVALRSAIEPEAFLADLATVDPDKGPDTEAVAEQHRAMTGAQVLAWFDASRASLLDTFRGLNPSHRVPWFGPAMSVASSLTARFMETWAHTQDIADALGVQREPTDRLRHVAHIAVGARAFSYAAHQLSPPTEPVHVALTAPSGAVWTWGPPDAADTITGPALDFCLLTTQRRHRDDVALTVHGPAAELWMSIAQTFAGPPGVGRTAGQFASAGSGR
jgi:uncharacterized protein (TIGR03084 family)